MNELGHCSLSWSQSGTASLVHFRTSIETKPWADNIAPLKLHVAILFVSWWWITCCIMLQTLTAVNVNYANASSSKSWQNQSSNESAGPPSAHFPGTKPRHKGSLMINICSLKKVWLVMAQWLMMFGEERLWLKRWLHGARGPEIRSKKVNNICMNRSVDLSCGCNGHFL